MLIKKLLIPLLLLSFILLSIPGCATQQKEGSTPPQGESTPAPPAENVPTKPPENQTLPSPNSTDIAPNPTGFPIIDEVSFPDGAPSLNHEARLTRTVYAKDIRIKNMRVSFSLPEGFMLVSGNLTWQGDIAKGEKVEIITAVVRAVKAGNWTIDIFTYIDSKEHGFMVGNLEGVSRGAIYVAVSEDSTQWGLTPPWYKKDGAVEPQPVPSRAPSSPIKAKLSLSKLPLVNEPVDLTLVISSQQYNAANSTAQIKLPNGVMYMCLAYIWLVTSKPILTGALPVH